jgi:uncharacterized protein YdbL (DUF1318 family)
MLLSAPLPAAALDDPVIMSAIRAGQVGEQADGYLGIVQGANASGDVRGRVNQINIQRRAYYQQEIQSTPAGEVRPTLEERARAQACVLFGQNVPVGAYYRGSDNRWRQHTASAPIQFPPGCSG